MSSGCLRDLVLRVGLDSMDQVWEQDRVLDEEDRDVVADNVEISLYDMISNL